MKDTALVVMAAGIGSRFGGGIKQLAPVGPNGEIIMDYSIHDALEAGFNKIVFIIRKDIEEEFRTVIGNRMEKIADVSYVFQDMHDLPEGFTCPEDRKKPWGTGQAVLACRKTLNIPFAVINADDYYGKEGLKKIHEFLVSEQPEDGRAHYCMAGFILGNTLSENGSVTRGICKANENGHLTHVVETHDICKTAEGAGVPDRKGGLTPVDVHSLVSMNMWGFTPDILDILAKGFPEFLSQIKPGDIKAEYLLPTIVDQLIQSGQADVTVLPTQDKWFGVTYKEDKDFVIQSFKELIEAGVYPENLYN